MHRNAPCILLILILVHLDFTILLFLYFSHFSLLKDNMIKFLISGDKVMLLVTRSSFQLVVI